MNESQGEKVGLGKAPCQEGVGCGSGESLGGRARSFCWRRRDILACSRLPFGRKNRQEWRQLVSRGGLGLGRGPSIGFLAQAPPTDSSAQNVLCVCVVTGGSTPPLTPSVSPVGTVAPVVPLL